MESFWSSDSFSPSPGSTITAGWTRIDSDGGFQALTIQGISSFFAMFGVVGFTLYHSAALGMALALVGALAAGVVSVWIIHRSSGR